ncbi:MAG TPA: putative pyridoxal-dependent aspartate 1-decarboxylase, partial [Desulfosalsimonadaceae bacterium]|nr:putative pyridoxal-dependent aspartate 1-decarboxylase [Desulfosalsimonadaceae bacterium]
MGPQYSANNPEQPDLIADWEHLFKVFIRPEDAASRVTLIKYMEQILFGLHDFLKTHVGITEAKSLKELSERFTDTVVRQNPEKKLADVITCVIDEIAPHAVNVASPYFVGHMTSAIPFFMVHLKTIVAALNQNVVKLETSKVVSVIEKQVIAKIHRLIYENSEAFYQQHVQNTETTLGAFVEGGTTANLTALWVARNSLLAPKPGFEGVEIEGMAAAFKAYDIDRAVILTSRLGHYSLRKSAGILGIGNKNIIPVQTDARNKIDTRALRQTIREIRQGPEKTAILAVVGIAGATETGTVDPLDEMADICSEHGIHFHVDAAWGGPTLVSGKYSHLLNGIKKANSVTIDGHKQFYMPMSCGMVYFKDPSQMDVVAYYANYVNRRGSVDLGIKSLSGSREANSLILDSALKIMGTKGYELLINHGIETARAFAAEISGRSHFELVTEPELNILTYRLCPPELQKELQSGDIARRKAANEHLNTLNRDLQRLEREAGRSSVSRTTLTVDPELSENSVVLRAVVMNPMTTLSVLTEILDE